MASVGKHRLDIGKRGFGSLEPEGPQGPSAPIDRFLIGEDMQQILRCGDPGT
jgi:hypothetical protein